MLSSRGSSQPSNPTQISHVSCTGRRVVTTRKLVAPMCVEPPRWHSGKEATCQASSVKAGLIPGLGRSPVEGNGYPLQYSCLEDPMDRGAW